MKEPLVLALKTLFYPFTTSSWSSPIRKKRKKSRAFKSYKENVRKQLIVVGKGIHRWNIFKNCKKWVKIIET
jgi:hypothetical protein